jgi:hypothetical protein
LCHASCTRHLLDERRTQSTDAVPSNNKTSTRCDDNNEDKNYHPHFDIKLKAGCVVVVSFARLTIDGQVESKAQSKLLVYSRRYPKYSRLTLPWIPLRLQALFTLFGLLGVGPDPRAASPLAWRRSICYPQHSARGRGRYHRLVCPLENTIKLSCTSRLMVYLYYYLIYEGIV